MCDLEARNDRKFKLVPLALLVPQFYFLSCLFTATIKPYKFKRKMSNYLNFTPFFLGFMAFYE